MFGYIKGTIKIIESNYVIIDNNGIGYIIYVANPYSYEIDKDYTIYTYTFISENGCGSVIANVVLYVSAPLTNLYILMFFLVSPT